MMEVFRIKTTAAYCGGAAYVAANDVEEAIKTFAKKIIESLNMKKVFVLVTMLLI